MPSSSTTRSTVPVAKWRTGSRSSNWAVRRSYQRPSVVDQSVPPAVVQSGLCADGNHSSAALHDTELAHAQVGTLRLKLLKIGAIVLRNTRRIRFLLSSVFPIRISSTRRQAAGSRIALDECCPGTLINNGVRGRCALEFRKYPLHSPSSGLTTWLHPTIANSAQNQRVDEIFGLVLFKNL